MLLVVCFCEEMFVFRDSHRNTLVCCATNLPFRQLTMLLLQKTCLLLLLLNRGDHTLPMVKYNQYTNV